MISEYVYFFDALGTITFSAYGGYLAVSHKFDVFGITVCAALTASGGGILRDIILQRTPVIFQNPEYVAFILLGIILVIFSRRFFEQWQVAFLTFDAIGLVTFSYIGSYAAIQANMSIVGVIVLGTLTAVGGGVLRDIVLNVQPEIMHRDVYASVAFLLSATFVVIQRIDSAAVNSPIIIVIVLGIGLLSRLVAMQYKLQLWRP